MLRAKQLLSALAESTDPKDKMRAVTLDALLFARLLEPRSRRSIFSDQLLENLLRMDLTFRLSRRFAQMLSEAFATDRL